MAAMWVNRFKYSFDRAETYRIACELETALEKLNSMLDWINDSEDEKTVNSLRCQVSLEVGIEHDLIDMGDIEQLASQCLNGEINTARIASGNAGMQKRESLSISVSPNPASTFVTISTDNELALLTILDPFGKVVFSKEINYDLVIDVSTFAKGVYSLQIKDAYGNRSTAKLVIS